MLIVECMVRFLGKNLIFRLTYCFNCMINLEENSSMWKNRGWLREAGIEAKMKDGIEGRGGMLVMTMMKMQKSWSL